MFYFDEFNGNKVLKSDYLRDITAFFTLREQNPPSFGVTPHQTHSDHIDFVDERKDYPNTDSLILTKPGHACYLRFADCSPIILYNPVSNVGAVTHAGWRGTAAKITAKTVSKMGGNPKDIIAVIGPTICVNCYEVSIEVRDLLLATVKDTKNLFNQMNVDLKGINAQQLKEAGVEKIDICPYCTACDNDLFYSYRKEHGTDKRHYAVLKL